MSSPLLHLALVEPTIPQNTGNAGRIALSFGLRLHLVGKLGFSTDEKACRRAGLDYWKHVDLARWDDFESFELAHPGARLFAFSARGELRYDEVEYRPGDALVFGNEQRGLAPALLARERVRSVRIPIASRRVRSLNLANAISIGAFEALRQLGFPGDRARAKEASACRSS
jgi:tRNA (cytidine/uridine-2'-O-)-methyltransferase